MRRKTKIITFLIIVAAALVFYVLFIPYSGAVEKETVSSTATYTDD